MWQGGCIRFIRKAEGSVAIISALALMGLVGVASLAVDMGHLYTVRNEMQNTADAAALAAAGRLIVDQGGVAVRDSMGPSRRPSVWPNVRANCRISPRSARKTVMTSPLSSGNGIFMQVIPTRLGRKSARPAAAIPTPMPSGSAFIGLPG